MEINTNVQTQFGGGDGDCAVESVSCGMRVGVTENRMTWDQNDII